MRSALTPAADAAAFVPGRLRTDRAGYALTLLIFYPAS